MTIPTSESYPLQSAFAVRAAEPEPFFAAGNGRGRYDAARHLWTPGRNAAGVITRQSFDLVPIGPWVEVAQTSFVKNVQPLLNAALPAYNDPGASDLADVLDDFSGFAHDAEGGRVFAHGGGHQGSANNGLYRLDLNRMKWAIAKLPDMHTHWPASYRRNPPRDNSYTIYPPARDYCRANPETTEVYHDMFFDPDTPAADTRNPTARHTYAAMTFADGTLRHGVRQYWEWSEATNRWSRRFPFARNCTTHAQPGGGITGEAVKGTWDELNQRYICGPFWNGTPGGFWSYDTRRDNWHWINGLPRGWEAYVATACRIDRSWCLFARPTSDKQYWPPKLSLWDLDSQISRTVVLTGLEHEKCVHSKRYDESTIMEYVPAIDRILLLMPYDIDDRHPDKAALPLVPFLIDVHAGTVEFEPQSGAFPALRSGAQVKNKFFYSARLNALVLVPDAGSNVLIRRFA